MATVRNSIINAAVAQIGELENCHGVYLHLEDALTDDELPVLLVGWASDTRTSIGNHDLHKLELILQAIASGKDADAQADALIGEAYGKLLEMPRSLGGLVKKIAPGDAQREATEQGQVRVTQFFTLDYLTLDNSLSVQP